jgi:hypothetical protein
MRISYAPQVLDSLEEAPASVRRAFWKQMGLLEQNLLHPSVRAKKYSEANDIWQGRVNREWRFYFQIVDGVIVIIDVIPHPK